MVWETIFMDGADHYATADTTKKWTEAAGGVTVDSTIFRNAGSSLKISTTSKGVSKSFQSARNVMVACAYYPGGSSQSSSAGSNFSSLMFLAAGSFGADNQVALAVLSDNRIRAYRGSIGGTYGIASSVELAAATDALTVTAWNHIQLRVFVDDTAGELELILNGVPQFSLTGIDTKTSGNNYIGSAMFRTGGDINASGYFDDIYIRTSPSETADSTGAFLGDLRIKPYALNGDGTYSQMTPSTGTDHYALLDEMPPSTTDYVSSSTALQKDSFTFQDISEPGSSVKAVQINALVHKDDSGFRGADLGIKSGATEDYSPTYKPVSITPKYVTEIWEIDPNTSVEFTQAGLNACELIVRTSADI